jgi:hypothetical protein
VGALVRGVSGGHVGRLNLITAHHLNEKQKPVPVNT